MLVVFLGLALVWGAEAQEQGGESTANAVFSDAVSVFVESRNKDEPARKEAAIEVLRLFDLIVTAYPDSIPGQRILAGGQIGPIDLDALRELAGVETGETAEAVANTTEVAGSNKTVVPELPPEKPPLQWHQRVLPTEMFQRGYEHGQFPSVGQRTHPGIDIISACDQDVTAPWDGKVELVVKAGHVDFPKTGNAIVLRHDKPWAPAVYSAYFFLGAAPVIDGFEVKKGQIIGKTGRLHGTEECGVHFEVRNSDASRGPIYPLWHDVLGIGDWGEDPDFLKSWREPVAWLEQLTTIETGKGRRPELLAQKEWVSIYRPGILGQFNKPQYRRLYSHNVSQGLLFTGNLRAARKLGGIEISTTHINAKINKAATVNLVKTGEYLSFKLRASIYSLNRPDTPLFQLAIPSGVQFKNNKLLNPKLTAVLVLPEDELIQGDFIRVEYVTEDGRSFLLGQDMALNATLDDANTESALAIAEKLAKAAAHCIKWDQGKGASITYALLAASGNRLKIEGSGWVSYKGLSSFRVEAVSKEVVRQIKECKGFRMVGRSGQDIDWFPLEMVLGGASQ
jgi:murein DD-endopeptidase MepM/ murein hydrolase activator NlpD